MSAVATREPNVRAEGTSEPPAQRLFEPSGPTLENSILAVWRELASEDQAICPVCSGEMTRAGGCASCGSQLG
jgi:hypothetical protein